MKPPTTVQASRDHHCFSITWQDGHSWNYPFKYLRQECRCAQCVHEISGERLLDPASVSSEIQVDDVKLVGNYAMKIVWSDGHDTGLYSWPRLRELCRCAACQNRTRANGLAK